MSPAQMESSGLMIPAVGRPVFYKKAANYNSIQSNFIVSKPVAVLESVVPVVPVVPVAPATPGAAVAISPKLTPTAALQARIRTLCPTMLTSHVAPFCTFLKKKKVVTDSDILAESLTWTPPSKAKVAAAAKPIAAVASKKVAIPKHVKTLVWNKYIGSDKAEAPCVSCRSQKISIRDFHCGHVLAEANGGDSTINNLRPICAPCNLSMGKRSMNEFTQEFFGWQV
jgi:hypothetical protein